MRDRVYLWAMLGSFGWLALLAALLYAVAAFWASPPSMGLFCLLWLGVWPPFCAFTVGWHKGRGGFMLGARFMALPLLLLALAWWWLLPELWQWALCLKAAAFGIIGAMLGGGAGVGFKAARLKLYPPPPDDPDTEQIN